jgi:hypothetical protein
MTGDFAVLRNILSSIAVLTLLAGPAFAHEEAKGPNGGPVVSVSGKHLELTTAGGEMTVYVSDESHSPIATAGGSGTAVIQDQGNTRSVALASGGANRLIGQAEAPIGKGARVVVSTKLPDGKSLQARFVAN